MLNEAHTFEGVSPVEKKKFSYFKLFTTMFLLSAFTFGGGYVIVTLMRKKFVDQLQWIEEDELLDLISIAQAAPGPVAVNASILVGYRLGGVRGFLASVTGTVLPPLIILSIVSLAYDAFRTNPIISAMLRTMQAGVAAIIADVVFDLGGKVVGERRALSILLMVAAFIATYFLGINIALIILACGVIGAIRAVLADRRRSK